MTQHTHPARGRVVAITGGARGIGRATADAFLREGALVAIGDVDTAAVEKTAAELAERTGGQVVGLPLDVTTRESFGAFLDATAQALGDLDVVVNNAGIMPTGLFAEEDEAMTDRIIDINLRGVINGSKLALEQFAGRPGHVVNVASLAGVSGYPGLATYCASKHAVVGFTEALHREVGPLGVGVTAVLPGVVRTELSAGNAVPDWMRPIAEVEPEDVADAIVEAVGTDRLRVVVPKALGATLKAMAVLPDRPRIWVERVAKFDTAFTKVDAATRDAYHRRVTGGDE